MGSLAFCTLLCRQFEIVYFQVCLYTSEWERLQARRRILVEFFHIPNSPNCRSLKNNVDNDLVHEAINRVARWWELCVAFLTKWSIATIEDAQIRFKYLHDVDFIDPCWEYRDCGYWCVSLGARIIGCGGSQQWMLEHGCWNFKATWYFLVFS